MSHDKQQKWNWKTLSIAFCQSHILTHRFTTNPYAFSIKSNVISCKLLNYFPNILFLPLCSVLFFCIFVWFFLSSGYFVLVACFTHFHSFLFVYIAWHLHSILAIVFYRFLFFSLDQVYVHCSIYIWFEFAKLYYFTLFHSRQWKKLNLICILKVFNHKIFVVLLFKERIFVFVSFHVLLPNWLLSVVNDGRTYD